MSGVKDGSHERRVQELEARLHDLEQEVRAVRQQQPAPLYPLERWHGRTYSATPSSYPASGNTFEVQLLDAHFTAAAGTQAVTEVARGDIVVARTWPGSYLARDTEVEVWRKRGMGALGSGEWWITTPKATFTNRAFWGTASYGLDYGGVQRNTFGHPSGGAKNLRLFPDAIEVPTPDTPDQYLDGHVGVNQGDAAITVVRAGSYLVWATMTWALPYLSVYDHRLLYDAGNLGLGQFAPPATTPSWHTSDASAGTSHYHAYWPFVPLDIRLEATLQVELTAALGGTSTLSLTDSIQYSAHHSGATGGYRSSTVAGHRLWTFAAGDTLRIDLSGRHNFPFASVLAPYDGVLTQFDLAFLWIC